MAEAGRIKLTPEELRELARDFVTRAGETRDLLQLLLDMVTRIGDTWDGAANNKFFGQYTDLQPHMQRFPEALDGIAATLDHVALTLEQTDQELASSMAGGIH